MATSKNTLEMRQEALSRATSGLTLSNYPAIFAGFTAKGIPESEIQPRVNVFTFQAWKALGRNVRKGEHGVHVLTFIESTREEKDDQTGEVKQRVHSRPWGTTVFHISQTEVR